MGPAYPLDERLATGVAGLDEVLEGGLVAHRTYLVRGGPGTGKTTLGSHFLAEGLLRAERCMLITMGESAQQMRQDAERVGLSLEGVEVVDLSPTSDFFSQSRTYDIFMPAEVEREPTTAMITERVEALRPQRVFLDAMTQFRFLAPDTFQFRRQVLSFLRYLVEQQSTVMFTSEGSDQEPDVDLQFMCDGVITLDLSPRGRKLTVSKFRGSGFLAGEHDMRLTANGMVVSPRLVPGAHVRCFAPELLPSGVPEFDQLLRGGIERGSIVLLTGPSGTGKTSIGLQFMKEAAGRGARSIIYSFEEEVEVMLRRSQQIGIPAQAMVDQGSLAVTKVEPLQYSPDEFAQMVRHEVEERDARIVMIDSVAGYRLSLRGEDLTAHLHALSKYLQNMGVATILVTEVESITTFKISDGGISYLADTIIYLRYFEQHVAHKVELKRAVGVLKKRLSDFDKTLRELQITPYGIRVLEPMSRLSGIVSGVPIQRAEGSEDQ